MSGRSRGQATVEFALVLPLVAVLALAVVQVALVARERVLVTHAARVGARSASVGATDAEVRRDVVAAVDLAADRVDVRVGRAGTTVEVVVTYRSTTDVPLAGALIADVELRATARMPREPP